MKKLLSIGILFVIVGFRGCYESTELKGLPPPTTTGERTMGFLVNGEPVYNKVFEEANAVFYAASEQLYLGGHFSNGSSIEISLYVPDFTVVQYTIDATDTVDGIFAEYRTEYDECKYGIGDNTRFESDPENVVTIEFTRLDRDVVSGTFTMKMKVAGCTDIEIIEGRFDLKVGHA